MMRIAAAGFAIMALAAASGCSTQGEGAPAKLQEVNRTTLPAEASAAAQSHAALSAAVLQAVNDYRADRGLARLAPDAAEPAARVVRAHNSQRALNARIALINQLVT